MIKTGKISETDITPCKANELSKTNTNKTNKEMKKITIEKKENVCTVLPTQYEGSLSDGRAWYLRYRCGWISIEVYHNGILHSEDDKELIIEKLVGDQSNSIIEPNEVDVYLEEFIAKLNEQNQ